MYNLYNLYNLSPFIAHKQIQATHAASCSPKVRCLGIEADLGRWQRFQRSVVANNFQEI